MYRFTRRHASRISVHVRLIRIANTQLLTYDLKDITPYVSEPLIYRIAAFVGYICMDAVRFRGNRVDLIGEWTSALIN